MVKLLKGSKKAKPMIFWSGNDRNKIEKTPEAIVSVKELLECSVLLFKSVQYLDNVGTPTLLKSSCLICLPGCHPLYSCNSN